MSTKPSKITLKRKPMTEMQFIQSPDMWPKWPVLPVVRRQGQAYEHKKYSGLVFASGKPVVILANLYALDGVPGETWADKLKGTEEVTYNSFEDLLKEWRID